ncbi:MAG: choice-of-anchor F family protein [Pseudomonadota bacterium]
MTGVRRSLSALLITGLVATSAHAGKITSQESASGAAGFGGFNLDNVEVIVNGAGSWFNPEDGSYSFSDDSDFTYQGNVSDGVDTIMGYLLAKDWPVGEPSGIKIINDDPNIKAPSPQNCILATSYLEDHFLDSADPQQVTCSSPFQSHKRYKVALLPETVDGEGSESVDLVFNVEAEDGSRDYEVFQKLNNWTDGRLEGFAIQVGFGVGDNFVAVEEAGVDLSNLNISVPSDTWSADQLANFSSGLFGPLDKHTGEVGFFDDQQRAGFLIDEYVIGEQPLTDTLHATQTLGSDYSEVPEGAGTNQFGPWLPNSMLPYGVFFDDDGNPETDAALLAWYGYNPATSTLGWMGGSQESFSAKTDQEIVEMGGNLSYTMDVIDDLVNVGVSYIVTVGDVSNFPSDTFTIRMTPTPDTSGAVAPSYAGIDPYPLLQFSSSNAEVLLEPKLTFFSGSLLTARVGDADLNLDPSVAERVTVTISAGDASEQLELIEQGENRGVFAATLPEAYSNVPAGTEVTMTYVDDNTGDAESGAVTKTSSTTAMTEPLPILSDVSITDLSVPDSVFNGASRTLSLSIVNDRQAQGVASGNVLITGSDGNEYVGVFENLRVGGKSKFSFSWTAELADSDVSETVEWTASVIINEQIVDDAAAVTQIDAKVRKNEK